MSNLWEMFLKEIEMTEEEFNKLPYCVRYELYEEFIEG